jgi:Mce-associated membrane protein
MSKRSPHPTAKEEATVPADTDIERAEDAVDDTAAEESTETADESTETTDETSDSAEPEKPKRRIQWARVFAWGVLPAVALLLAMGAGYLKWMDNSVRNSDVVIPGAKQKQISAVATVAAVASASAEPNHAVVLVFVNQTVAVGQDAPTDTASSVRVTLDKVGDRWLISKFDPV